MQLKNLQFKFLDINKLLVSRPNLLSKGKRGHENDIGDLYRRNHKEKGVRQNLKFYM